MTTTLIQADGKMPNLALARIASWAVAQGDHVRLVTRPTDDAGTECGVTYGSTLFSGVLSSRRRAAFDARFGPIVWGGTGADEARTLAAIDPSAAWDRVMPDWSLWPQFTDSIGITSRGCRQRCPFCVVPRVEGAIRTVAEIGDFWRADRGRKLHLLDPDFFGQETETWRAHIACIRKHDLAVCFEQGINVRRLDDEAARALVSIRYSDRSFTRRYIYTAWDNLRDETAVLAGLARLRAAGCPPHNVRVYLLIGYDEEETWDERFHRLVELVRRGHDPYPMVYQSTEHLADPALRAWQRWVVRGWYAKIPWSRFDDARLAMVDRPPRFDAAIAEALVEMARSSEARKRRRGGKNRANDDLG